MQFALQTNRKQAAISADLPGFLSEHDGTGQGNSAQRKPIHLFSRLKHMEITMQYLNKGSISGGFPTFKIHSCNPREIFSRGCGQVFAAKS